MITNLKKTGFFNLHLCPICFNNCKLQFLTSLVSPLVAIILCRLEKVSIVLIIRIKSVNKTQNKRQHISVGN